jgi:cysteine desulfurase
VALETSRERVAEALGAAPAEIVFTSGATEANNLALQGVLGALGREAGLLTSEAEHEAVLAPAEALRAAGHLVIILSPTTTGAVDPDAVVDALGEQVRLVSFMHTNNELGTRTPLAPVVQACREHGVLVHTDAVQAAAHEALDVDALGVDLLSLSAHKLGGPKGMGALYVRQGTPLQARVHGGAQERRRRGGTENVAGAVGLAAALEKARRTGADRATALGRLRDRLGEALVAALGDGVRVNTPADAAPHILNVSFPPNGGRALDGEMLLLGLDLAGVCASNGSACSSGAVEPSHVLRAIGLERETAAATVRFSLGRGTTADDIDIAVRALLAAVRRQRAG